jgi:NADH dehydrogenase FAD-containing subunit
MKIVILGGGFGGVYTLKYLHKLFCKRRLCRPYADYAEKDIDTDFADFTQTMQKNISAKSASNSAKSAYNVKLVLVNKKNYFLFTPLLHEFATGSVSLENLVEPIREIIRCCDYEFIHGEVKRIDLEKKIVYVDTQTLQTSRRQGGINVNNTGLTQINVDQADLTQTGQKNINTDSADLTQTGQNKISAGSASSSASSASYSAKSAFHSAKSAIISYDYLIIALGSKTNFYNIPGAEENSFTLKSLDDAIRLRNHFIHMFEKYTDSADLTQTKQKNIQNADFEDFTQTGQTFNIDADKAELTQTRQTSDMDAYSVDFTRAIQKNISAESASYSAKSAFLTFVIVGGGATGVELAAEMSDYFYKTFSKFYPKEIISKVKIILIERGNELIPQFSPKLRKIALEVLRKKNVEVILGKGVKEVGKDFIKLDDEAVIKTKTVIWTAGVEPNLPEIVGNIEKDSRGRLIVNEYLQVKNYNNVFALGDICCFIQNQKPLPQLAQVAVRQAKIVAKNIFNLIKNKPLEKFVYKHQGDLISLGRFFAIGEIQNFTFSGFFTWILWRGVYLSKMISNKDKIKTFIDWLLDFFYPRDITEI